MLHDGHRERLRNKAMEHGFVCLEEHECLELLLGFSILRRNTNEVAHELINRAGSLSGVFDMELSELKKVPGVGRISAFLIKLVAYIMSLPKQPRKNRADFSKLSLVRAFSQRFFAALDREVIYAFYLDKRMGLIEKVRIAEGSEWHVGVSPREILTPALLNGAASFLIIHNHPHGETKPSRDDMNFTVRLESAASAVGLIMVEHLVYAEGELYPIMKGVKIHLADSIEYDEVQNDV